jgi:GYD domain-containing protein
MPTYVVLLNWTDQGVRADRETVHRREHADALAEKHGGRIEQVYWTMGHYDSVAIIEAPRRRDRHGHDARANLGGQPQDEYASRLRSRRDAGDNPENGLRDHEHTDWAGAPNSPGPSFCPYSQSAWK